MTEGWTFDSRVVPAYALTRGRTRSVGADLRLEALVTATTHGLDRVGSLQVEHRTIVEMCVRPLSVAEVAARVRVPLGVARVLVSDLAAGGYLAVHLPVGGGNQRPDAALLERLLDGLRAR